MNLILKIIIFLISFSAFAGEGAKSENTKKSIIGTIGNDLIYVLEDFAYVGGSIFRLDSRDAAVAGGVLGSTVVLFAVDEKVHEFFLQKRNRDLDVFFSDYTDKLGRIGYCEILSGGIYLSGLIAGSDGIRKTGRLLFEALAVSGTAVMAFRYGFGRARPYMEEGLFEFRHFHGTERYQSFPSGHTAVAFSVATVLAARIDEWWSYAGFYSLASLVPLGRVYLDQHWSSDLLLGAAVGVIGAASVLSAEEYRQNKSASKKGLSLRTSPLGIHLSYKF